MHSKHPLSGFILNKYSWRNPDEELADLINKFSLTKLIKNGFPDGILLYQKLYLKHPDPTWRATHSECIVPYDKDGLECPLDEVWTFSQEEVAKCRKRKLAHVLEGMDGERPQYVLYKPTWSIGEAFIEGMMKRFNELWGKGKPFLKRIWAGIYDVGQIAGYLINAVRGLFGAKKRVRWLDIKGKEDCSSAVASGERCGLDAEGYGWQMLYPLIPSTADFAPSHFGNSSVLIKQTSEDIRNEMKKVKPW